MYEFVSPMEPVVMRAPKAFKWPEQTTVIPPIMIHGTLTEKHLDIWQLFILVTVNYTDKKKQQIDRPWYIKPIYQAVAGKKRSTSREGLSLLLISVKTAPKVLPENWQISGNPRTIFHRESSRSRWVHMTGPLYTQLKRDNCKKLHTSKN